MRVDMATIKTMVQNIGDWDKAKMQMKHCTMI